MDSLSTDILERNSRAIVEVGRRLYVRGLVGGSEGNISVRLDGNRILATPSGVSKGYLDADSLVLTDLDGRAIEGRGRPSSELAMHLKIYASRVDVSAVVHAHPPIATGFAIAGRSLSDCVVPEVIATLGWVPVVPYATPSTEELPERMAPYIGAYNALLLANHGAVTYAASLDAAINTMESLEQASHSLLVAHLLGNVNRLSRSDVDRIIALDAYGSGVQNAGCAITDERPLADRGEVDARKIADEVSAIVRETLRSDSRGRSAPG